MVLVLVCAFHFVARCRRNFATCLGSWDAEGMLFVCIIFESDVVVIVKAYLIPSCNR